jgi:hypothetical protein
MEERTMADDKKPKKGNDDLVADPKIHRRLLRFINAARDPEDLALTPNEREVTNEEEEHADSAESAGKEPELKPVFDAEAAKGLIEARDRVSPIRGVSHINDLIEVNPVLVRQLPDLIALFGAARFGRWDLLYPLNPGGTPMAIEHAALMRNYKVVFLADGTDTAVWDPANEVTPNIVRLTSAQTGLASNIVCCGHSFLSDGRLLAAGGGGLNPGNPTSIQAWKFDPMTQKWTRTAGNMSQQRWYPTAMTMADEGATPNTGRVLVGSGGNADPIMEVYNEATDTFSPVTVNGPIHHNFPQRYPGFHLLPGNEMFYVPTGFGDCSRSSVAALSDPSAFFTFSGALAGSWTNVGPNTNRTKGMSALFLQNTYPFVRVFVAGGGDLSTSNTVQVANLSTCSPSWGPKISIPDGRARINVNVVLLPDGTALIVGGLSTPPLTCYRYNPNTAVNAFSEMDEMIKPRHYHSCALLLPSGKVMAAGGGSAGGCSVSVENTIEVFSPPYLFNPDGSLAVRPKITKVNGVVPTATTAPNIDHGAKFTIETTDAPWASRVVLVRPVACTHNTDTEQRVIQCSVEVTDNNKITAQAPNGLPPAIAPRGYYMLFVFNNKGVPSEGKFVRLF